MRIMVGDSCLGRPVQPLKSGRIDGRSVEWGIFDGLELSRPPVGSFDLYKRLLMNVRFSLAATLIVALGLVASSARAQGTAPMGNSPKSGTESSSSGSTESKSSSAATPLYASILKDAKPVSGMWNV